jgi:hypothetical protein
LAEQLGRIRLRERKAHVSDMLSKHREASSGGALRLSTRVSCRSDRGGD